MNISKPDQFDCSNGAWDDTVFQLNPFIPVLSNGGSNGEKDVEFKQILRTDRFYVDLPDAILLPKQHSRVYVVERIFKENYENLFITWNVKLADGSINSPFHFIGLHETDYKDRRYPDDAVMSVDMFRIPDETIERFRRNAAMIISKAQHRALNPPPPRKELPFNQKPVSMI